MKMTTLIEEDDGTSSYQNGQLLVRVLEIKVQDTKLWFVDEKDCHCGSSTLFVLFFLLLSLHGLYLDACLLVMTYHTASIGDGDAR